MTATREAMARLRELAGKATPGPRQFAIGEDVTGYPYFAPCGLSGDAKRDHNQLEADAAYLAAVDRDLGAAMAAVCEAVPKVVSEAYDLKDRPSHLLIPLERLRSAAAALESLLAARSKP